MKHKKIIIASIAFSIILSSMSFASWRDSGYIWPSHNWKRISEITPTPTPDPTPTPNPTPTPTPEPTPTPTPTPNPTPTPIPDPTPITTPIYYDSFEGSFAQFWSREAPNTTYSLTTSKNYAINGVYSLRSELRIGDTVINDGKRSELAINKLEIPREEHNYNISILLPSTSIAGEEYLTDPNSREILIQWHNYPDSGEQWTSPPLSLETKNGHYYLSRLWDDAVLSTNDSIFDKGYYEFIDLGSYLGDKGNWVNWKFHVKWGWLASQSPILEVYKNNTLIYSANGKPNMTNDQHGVYMKIGIYKWEWQNSQTPSILTKRVVYYDNINIY